MAKRFVSSTKEEILEFQNASRNTNIDKPNNTWMSLFVEFCEVQVIQVKLLNLTIKHCQYSWNNF
jgi:hypothetical protein